VPEDHSPEIPLAQHVECSVRRVEQALGVLGGRWKMTILFHPFARPLMRYSELERAIEGISQKMLGQQLRELERDGLVERTVHPQVPPRVDYALTDVGRALRPTLESMARWAKLRELSTR
jgi:DNA-binding HxlR family transcriptional regulator